MNLITLLRKGYLGVAFATGISLLVFMLIRPGMEGDSFELVKNAYDIPGCLAAHRWGACPEAGQYPLYQILPSLVFALVGLSKSFTLHFLAYLSFGVFVSVVGLTWRLLAREHGERVAWVGVLALLAGYPLRYLNSSFGEMLAAGMISAAAASVLAGVGLDWTALAVFGAGLSKETAPPFVWIFVLAALWMRGRFRARDLVVVSGAAGLAMAANLGFTYFKYSTVLNPSYISPINFETSLWVQIGHFFGSWCNPRMGVFWYWPFFFFIGVLCLGFAWSSPVRARVPFLLVVLALAGLSFGFGKLKFWYGPIAWGDRYLVPWLPVTLLIGLMAYGGQLERRFFRWAEAHRAWSLGLGAVLAFLSLPQYRVLFRHQWVDLIAEQRFSLFSMLVPGPWIGEWVGSLVLASLVFYGWSKKVSGYFS